jgi:glycosyltransferase involved in cell wall biosynthesis
VNRLNSRLAIGLLGFDDPADVRSFSGTPFHLSHFLRAAGHKVRPLGPYPIRHRSLVRSQNRLTMTLLRQQLLLERHWLISRQYPGIVNRYVAENPGLDLLLATCGLSIAGVRSNVPIILWGDTTVAGVLGRYKRYTNLSKRTIARAHAVEQAGLDACDLAIFSSRWAAEVARNCYRLDPQKVRVITYGPGLLETPSEKEIARLLPLRDPQRIKIVLIGIGWQRKGADKAIEIVRELRKQGMPAELTIVGCAPPRKTTTPPFVTILGRITKYDFSGANQLTRLLGESHLLILPSIAECAAVALAEANAFGVPFLSTDVGGNSSLVEQGYNGMLLPAGSDTGAWVDAARTMLSDRPTYERFAWQAYSYFQERLSWEPAVAEFERHAWKLTGRDSLREPCLRAAY